MHGGPSRPFPYFHQHETWRAILRRPKSDQEPAIVNELCGVIMLAFICLHVNLSFYQCMHPRNDIQIMSERFASPK